MKLRDHNDPRLREQVTDVVKEFIATQAEDGYLGPFPKGDRLLKNWDLWGHYHALQALVLWHEQTGEAAALTAARQAADLVCATYLDSGRRVLDAGDPEMNMAILTALARLHRLTGDARAADELELATLNGGLGAQHPSGRWWTYNTPMDGAREASAHTIVFQARP